VIAQPLYAAGAALGLPGATACAPGAVGADGGRPPARAVAERVLAPLGSADRRVPAGAVAPRADLRAPRGPLPRRAIPHLLRDERPLEGRGRRRVDGRVARAV